MLINQPSFSQTLWCEVINRIHGDATTCEGKPAKRTTYLHKNTILPHAAKHKSH